MRQSKQFVYISVAQREANTAHLNYARSLCRAIHTSGLMTARLVIADTDCSKEIVWPAELSATDDSYEEVGIRLARATREIRPYLLGARLLLSIRKYISSNSVVMTHSDVVAMALHLRGIPFYFDFHQLSLNGRLIRWLFNAGAIKGYVANSRRMLNLLRERVSSASGVPSIVLGSGVPSQLAARRSGIFDWSGSGTTVGYVGSLGRDRGLDYLIDAAGVLKKTSPDVIRWVIVGGRPEQVSYWKEKVTNHQVADVFEFLGHRTQESLPSIYAKFDLLCAPYTTSVPGWEVMAPMKLVEYLVVGKPVVAPNIEAVKEILGNSGGWLSYEMENRSEFRAAIVKYLAHRRKFQEAARQFRDKNYHRFTWEAKARSLMNWLSRVDENR